MLAAFDFHDSYLTEIDSPSETILINAYVHRRPEIPDDPPAEGGYQLLRMHFSDIKIEGELEELPGDIYTGSLFIGNEEFNELIPVDFKAETAVSVVMSMRDGQEIAIRGTRMIVTPAGEYKFLEFWRG